MNLGGIIDGQAAGFVAQLTDFHAEWADFAPEERR